MAAMPGCQHTASGKIHDAHRIEKTITVFESKPLCKWLPSAGQRGNLAPMHVQNLSFAYLLQRHCSGSQVCKHVAYIVSLAEIDPLTTKNCISGHHMKIELR